MLACFFVHDKSRAREGSRQRLAAMPGGDDAMWVETRRLAATVGHGSHPIRPFHWEVEFPEVFAGTAPGFDAIVGNPPFAGKNTITAASVKNYLPWLQTLHEGAHGNADLVAHFFRRAFGLLRQGGVFGPGAWGPDGELLPERCPSPEALAALPRLNAFINEVSAGCARAMQLTCLRTM